MTYYVDTEQGSDSNTGNALDTPFKTIRKASSVVSAGDICYIRKGTYRETVSINVSGTIAETITFQAYNKEQVIIKGTDIINAWILHSGNIYKTTVSKYVTQLFANESQMSFARWPNTPENLLKTNNSTISMADMGSVQDKPWVAVSNLPDKDWVGAKAWILSGGSWGALSTTIVEQSENRLYIESNPSTNSDLEPKTGGQVYLYDNLSALDEEKEYYYESDTETLYFQAPNNANPNQMVIEARTRKYGFDLNTSKYVTIKGITFHAASLNVEGSHCVVEDCRFYYPTPFTGPIIWTGSSGIEIYGNNNTMKYSEVAYSWGDGITTDNSSYNNVIENNLVHDCNWSASWSAGINTKGSEHSITHNTIYNVGRTGIRFYDFEGGEINYNNIFNYGYLTSDLGGVKTGNNHLNVTEIAYNWVHDTKAIKLGSGIYLDSGVDNFLVHHNVCWNSGNAALRSNREAVNIDFYNNTLTGSRFPIGHFAPLGEQYIDVVTRNNISTINGKTFLGSTLSNNYTDTKENFAWAGYSYGDFRLTIDSSAIDAGTLIAGITNNFSGVAPDAGAYEYGGDIDASHWIPGVTWSPDWNAAPKSKFTYSSSDNLQVSFDASNSEDVDGGIIRYLWDFGDGTLSPLPVVTHQYAEARVYNVSLTTNDSYGGSNTVFKRVSIEE